MFKFVGNRRYWFSLSGALMVLAIASLVYNGFVRGQLMNFGLDFTGGTLLNLRFVEKVSVADVRGVLSAHNLQDSVIQRSEAGDIFIRTGVVEPETREKIMAELRDKFGDVELLEADTVGPVIGKELRMQAIWALIIASIGITIYVSFRFEFKFAAAALFALYHDAIITTGLIAFLWCDVQTPFVAAIMTIMGYSINDTIVIFDRIRENVKKFHGKRKPFNEIVDLSINETMARSINTVLTTIIAVLALLFFGGATLKDFALTLLIGFSFGAYSSIFIASPIVAVWHDKE